MRKTQTLIMTRMRAERIRRGWSQQALAERAGIGVADVSRIENGRLQPYPLQAHKIADVLGIPTSELQEPSKLKVVTT